MKKTTRFVALASTVLIALAFFPYTSAPGASSITVRIIGKEDVQINTLIYSTFSFSPRKVHVSQFATVTFENFVTGAPHTLSIVNPSDLPTNFEEVFSCGPPGTVCFKILVSHFPNGFPPAGQPVMVVEAPGSATGLDAPGDSILLFPGLTFSATVSATPGTALSYLCAFHPWMQGSIEV